MPLETLQGTAELGAFKAYLDGVQVVEEQVQESFRSLPVVRGGTSSRSVRGLAARSHAPRPLYDVGASFREDPTQRIRQGQAMLELDEEEFAAEDALPQEGWSQVADNLTKKLRLELILVALDRRAPLERSVGASGSFASLMVLARNTGRSAKTEELIAPMSDDEYERACASAPISITGEFNTASPQKNFSGFNLHGLGKLIAEFIWRNPGVTSLNFHGCRGMHKQSAIVLSHAVCNNKVAKVDLSSSDADVEFAAALAVAAFKSSSIKEINLAFTKVSAAGAVFWGGLLKAKPGGSLVDLNLQACGLGNDGAIGLSLGLASHNSLKVLNLAENNIARLGCIKLGASLANNTVLEILTLDDNEIGSRGATAIAHALQNPACMLTEVYMSNCGVGPNGGKALAVAIWENTRIQKLVMRHNDMSDPGIGPFGPCLLKNHSLRYLDLSDNDMTDLGASGMALGLGSDCSLHTLMLSRQIIKDVGVSAMCNALMNNTRLESLLLDENGMHDVGAVALAAMLCRNKSLRELRLQANEIGDEGATALGRVLVDKSNTTLEVLDVSDNPISDRISVELFAKAEGRQVQGDEKHLDVMASGTRAAKGNLVLFGVTFIKQEVPPVEGFFDIWLTLALNIYSAASHIEICAVNWIKALAGNQGVSFYYPVFMTFFLSFTYAYILIVLSLPGKATDMTLPISEALTAGWTGGSQSLKAHLEAVRGTEWNVSRVKITIANLLFCRQAYEAFLSWKRGWTTILYSSVSLATAVFLSIPLSVLQINLLMHVQQLEQEVAYLNNLNQIFSNPQTAIILFSVLVSVIIVARTAADLFEKSYVIEWKRNALANEGLAMLLGEFAAVSYHLVHFAMRAFVIALAAEIFSPWIALLFFIAMAFIRTFAWFVFRSQRSFMFCLITVFVGSASWDRRVLARLSHFWEIIEVGVVLGVMWIPVDALAQGASLNVLSDGDLVLVTILEPRNVTVFLCACLVASLCLYFGFIERIHEFSEDIGVKKPGMDKHVMRLAQQPFIEATREKKQGIHKKLRQHMSYHQQSGVFTGFQRHPNNTPGNFGNPVSLSMVPVPLESGGEV